jgi:uncharacterized membrane protein YccC
MPTMFAVGDKLLANPVIGTFAAFGSFAMIILVDFTGPIRDRLSDQAALSLACGGLIALGTLASRTTWLAALGMAAVAFAILFSGVVSSVLASASTSLLLAFILPVSLPGPASSIPDRVLGWALAAAASLLAIALLWPAPARNPVRAAAIDACRAFAERLRSEAAFVLAGGEGDCRRRLQAAIDAADSAVRRLQSDFYATPYRPTGLATDARAVIRLVDELRWLNVAVLHATPKLHRPHRDEQVCRLRSTAAEVLERSADLLEDPDRGREQLMSSLEQLHAQLEKVERAAVERLPTGDAEHQARRAVSALDPSFRAQELSFVVAQIGTNTGYAAAAAERTWLDRLLGRQPAGLSGPLAAFQERAGAHAGRDSVWLHNSLRGAAALALAVVVADVSTVQHGFWVAFGTLSVLRSNALSTGQNTLRALGGTVAGFVIGGLIVYLIGADRTVLWIVLPVAVLLAGLAPATLSFAAGQAAFTLTLLVLFNLIAPAGWTIGLVRIEDIALGGAVSLVVGLLFWPRGAGSALGRALESAYAVSARYLADAVAYGVGRCDRGGPSPPRPSRQATEAAAASRRLDDTFRGYLSERGAKRLPLAEVTSLVTGVTGLRLAADAVLDLWDGDSASGGDREAARRELLGAAGNMTSWYDQFAVSLSGGGGVPEPLGADEVADGRLVDAVAQDLRDGDGRATSAGVKVIWTGDHLDAVRRLQESLVAPARAAIGTRGR